MNEVYVMQSEVHKVMELGILDENVPYRQSANTLFHFMPKFEFLLNNIKKMKLFPRYVREDVDYLNLKIGNRCISQVAFPMLCFCDIHLHSLSYHVEPDLQTGSRGYGKYGIGLDKKWCEQKGFSPISYINKESKQCKELSSILNNGLDSLITDSSLNEDFFDYLLNQLRFSKPLQGTMDNGSTTVTKNFHDEREWRFIPDMSQTNLTDFLNDATKSKYMAKSALDKMSDSLQVEYETHLKLSIDAIKYIFVSTEKDRNNLLQEIGKIFPKKTDALMLSSKIIVYDQIARDW